LKILLQLLVVYQCTQSRAKDEEEVLMEERHFKVGAGEAGGEGEKEGGGGGGEEEA